MLLPCSQPSEDVWILSSLYEMIFLQEALERLDWQAEELAAQSKEGLITQHIVVFMVRRYVCLMEQCGRKRADGWGLVGTAS